MAHAKLSASSSAKWLACAGSIQAEKGLFDSGSSFAEEGTLAHELAELCLTTKRDPLEFVGLPLSAPTHTVTHEMAEYIQGYIDYCQSLGGEQHVEVRVDYSKWVRDGFGTSDFISISDDGKTIHCVDLKYGKGVPVYAENNSQGMLYALGTLADLDTFSEAETVNIHIYQPRIANFSNWAISVPDLLRWAEWVRERALLTEQANAPRTAGEKQCQWCKVKGICKTLADYSLAIINADFDTLSPEELTPADKLSTEQLAQVLDAKSLIIGWLDAVNDEVLRRVANGEQVAGYKLVTGRSVRVWRDETAAIDRLTETFADEELFTRKFISPTQADKLCGKQHAALLTDLIDKPQGKPTLAPASDKRPSISDSSSDFETI